jgi:hypothetical protein
MAVEFEEEKNFSSAYNKAASKSNSSLASWIVKNGWAKDEKGANTVMIVITIICFALAAFLIFK